MIMMKCAMMFLVLTLVVLMAEPGEGFFHHIHQAIKAFKRLHGIFSGEELEAMRAQEAMEQRALQRENDFA
ncbi:hypothetical protein NQZ68_018465 [Dissostichus eleginoides]|nr:hypothetical protein NQZ68_018465 [Dissostichus eleginoides]